MDFGRRIRRSHQSVIAYEKHPEDTPAEVIQSLKTIAAATGHADWAVFLSSDNWRVARVIEPGETLISAPPRPHPASGGATSRESLHGMLDEILDSGDPDALNAVVPNLVLFHKWVEQKSPKMVRAKKRKSG